MGRRAAYDANLAGATETIIEADTVAAALRGFMMDLTEWRGTASELLVELTDVVTERISRDRDWPRNGRALSGKLRRSAPLLREVGIHIAFPTSHYHGRALTIYRLLENGADFASQPSRPSRSELNPKDFNEETRDANRDANRDADFCVPPIVPANSLTHGTVRTQIPLHFLKAATTPISIPATAGRNRYERRAYPSRRRRWRPADASWR
jgi:hypothetical protein